MFYKDILIKIDWFITSQLGINFKIFFRSFIGLPFYIYNLSLFIKKYRGKLLIKPCLLDRFDTSGAIHNEYFWQDLIVARRIYERNPKIHIDIGSKVDGFVSHVASYREIECFDIRNQINTIPNVKFHIADITGDISQNLFLQNLKYCDSLSCLHVLEHFGLGRYGDKVNPTSYKDGLLNISKIISTNGILYLSIPIGIERVEFDANWIFNPLDIIYLAESFGLKFSNLTIINTNGIIFDSIQFNLDTFEKLSNENYNLGLFEFTKI